MSNNSNKSTKEILFLSLSTLVLLGFAVFSASVVWKEYLRAIESDFEIGKYII